MAVVPLSEPDVIPNLLRANWSGVVQVEPNSQTDVTASRETGAEDRRQLVERPSRTLNVTLTGMSQEESLQLWMNLLRTAGDRTWLPLFTDQGVTDATSSGQFINLDTALKRFYPGARVVIFDVVDGLPDQIEYRTIVAVTATQIDLGAVPADQLQNTYAAGAYVFPLLDIEVDIDASKGIHQTDYHFEVSFEATEVVGQSALPYLEDGLPSGFPTYLGYPILTISPHWGAALSSSARHHGDAYELGVGMVVEPRGSRPTVDHSLSLRALSRESAWPLLRFIESRAGRLRPWWLVNPASLFTAEAITTTHVDVTAIGNLEDMEDFLASVVIEVTGSNPIVRDVSGVTQVGDLWRIAFATTITAPSLGDIVRVTSAHLVRNSKDAHREVWTSDGIIDVSLEAEDLIDEATYAISGIDMAPPTLGPLAEIDDLYLWVSAGGPCWADLDGGGLTPTDPTIAWPQDLQGLDDVDFAYDVRRPPTDIDLVEPYLQRWDPTDGDSAPALAYFHNVAHNNGQRTFYHFAIDELVGWTLENSQAPFWDDTEGLTIIIVARFGGPAVPGSFVDHFHFFREGIFEWFGNGTTGEVRMFETADAVVGAANFTYTEPTDSTLRILAFRWDPGVVAELFIGGGAAVASAATPAASLDPDPRPTDVMQYLGPNFTGPLGGGSGHPQQINFNLDRVCMSNELYVAKRALTDSEINEIATWFADKYDILWDNVT
jgi:hypothetical protein